MSVDVVSIMLAMLAGELPLYIEYPACVCKKKKYDCIQLMISLIVLITYHQGYHTFVELPISNTKRT